MRDFRGRGRCKSSPTTKNAGSKPAVCRYVAPVLSRLRGCCRFEDGRLRALLEILVHQHREDDVDAVDAVADQIQDELPHRDLLAHDELDRADLLGDDRGEEDADVDRDEDGDEQQSDAHQAHEDQDAEHGDYKEDNVIRYLYELVDHGDFGELGLVLAHDAEDDGRKELHEEYDRKHAQDFIRRFAGLRHKSNDAQIDVWCYAVDDKYPFHVSHPFAASAWMPM